MTVLARKDYTYEENWLEVSKFRTGQVTLYSKSEKLDHCPLCKHKVEVDIEHLLTVCSFINNQRFPAISNIKDKHMVGCRVVEEVLNTKLVNNELAKLWKDLKKEGGDGSKMNRIHRR